MNSAFPLYNSVEAHALPSGLYLGLFHGRDDSKQEMQDWGYDGPQIGPCEYVHTTYGEEVKVCLRGQSDAELILRVVDSCLAYNGKFYGDWTVFYYEQRRKQAKPVEVERRRHGDPR